MEWSVGECRILYLSVAQPVGEYPAFIGPPEPGARSLGLALSYPLILPANLSMSSSSCDHFTCFLLLFTNQNYL